MTLDIDLNTLTSRPLSLEIDEPLTHLSTNSKAAVRFEIHKQERVHWFLGLRQAELTIRDKLNALHSNRIQEREQLREMRAMKREYDKLKAKGVAVTPDQSEEMEKIEDRFLIAQHAWLDLRPLIRDAELELATAKAEKERLVAEHPEVTELSFEALQDLYSQACLFEKQAHFFAAEVWAAVNHLPGPLGHLLFDAPVEQREALMLREAEVRTGVKIDETTIQAARRIMQLPLSQQQEIVGVLLDPQQHN